MRIGMILKGNFPPDIRIEKESRTLIALGHKVYLLAYMRTDFNEPTEKYVDGLLVRYIPPPKISFFTFHRSWNYLRFHLTFRDRYWATRMECYIHDFELEALHVHDLPLVGTAISVGRRLSIPVIADLHENYPAALKIWHSDKHNLKAWITTNPKHWALYEGRAVRLATHVIVVVDEAKDRLIKQHNIPAEKITVLMNVEDVDYFQSIKTDSEILSRYRDVFVISYIGGSGLHRGLDTVIHSIPYLKEMVPRLKFLLVGPQDDDRSRLETLAKAENVKDFVEVIGWQPFSKVPSYIQASEICLVPHQQNLHTDSTIPHKLFQYMLMSKPVVVSSCLPLKRIIEDTESGLVFQAGNSRDLAKKIRMLYANKQLRQDCGRWGHRAVLNQYNWGMEGRKLCLLYKSLQGNSEKTI